MEKNTYKLHENILQWKKLKLQGAFIVNNLRICEQSFIHN